LAGAATVAGPVLAAASAAGMEASAASASAATTKTENRKRRMIDPSSARWHDERYAGRHQREKPPNDPRRQMTRSAEGEDHRDGDAELLGAGVDRDRSGCAARAAAGELGHRVRLGHRRLRHADDRPQRAAERA